MTMILRRLKLYSMKKVVTIGVKEVDVPLFEKIKDKIPYDLTIYNSEENYMDEKIYDDVSYVITSSPTILLGDDFFSMMERKNIPLVVAKMTGVGNIDLQAAKNHNVAVANVQGYSPNAISELAISMAMSLNRNLFAIQFANQHNDFRITYPFFKEIRDCTVGIYGMGRIGSVSAKLFSSLGSKVIGWDPHPNKDNEFFMQYVELQQLLKQSDILVLHSPYIKGVNYHVVDEKFIVQMKSDALLINVARGELVDLKAINKAIKEKKLAGYATDVLENEQDLFGLKVDKVQNEDVSEAISLYPQVIITPHVGAHTSRARNTMVQIAFDEIEEFEKTSSCRFRLV